MERRTFLQLCAAGAGAYAIGGVPSRKPAKRLILVFATGGWDTSYALDPKDPAHVDVPAGAPRTFEGLDVFCDPSRPSVTAFFERHAGVSAIVRGISTDAINHNECQRRIATGTREETHPDVGATVAHELGNELPLPYLILGDTAWTGAYASSAGRIGASNQLVTLLDPDATPPAPPAQSLGDAGPARPAAGLSDAERALVRDYAQASATRARAIRGQAGYNRRRVDDFVQALDRSERLRTLRGGLGAAGRMLDYGGQIEVALDALAHDLSQTVMVSPLLPWDTHGDNHLQGGFHDQTFAGLTRLLDELAARPGRAAGTRMLDDTVVVVLSEMARTQRLTSPSDPHAGKGHWPVTAALVAGAGVRGGRVWGATDPDCLALPIDLHSGALDPAGTKPLYSHFIAGVLALCGVDPKDHLQAPVFDAFVV